MNSGTEEATPHFRGDEAAESSMIVSGAEVLEGCLEDAPRSLS